MTAYERECAEKCEWCAKGKIRHESYDDRKPSHYQPLYSPSEWPKWVDTRCPRCDEFVPKGYLHQCDEKEKEPSG